MFRKFLIKLRGIYNNKVAGSRKKAIIWISIIFGISTVGAMIVDATLPFNGWWNILRTAILLLLGGSIFVGGYFISYFLHLKKSDSTEKWVPYRLRFSLMWRRRIAIIIAAVMIVLIYGIGFRVGYTFVSSVFFAGFVSLFAFIRPTRTENAREDLGIPDNRDIRYQNEVKEREKLLAKKESEKLQSKSQKRFERYGYKDKNFKEQEK